jgi:hypothetical protein
MASRVKHRLVPPEKMEAPGGGCPGDEMAVLPRGMNHRRDSAKDVEGPILAIAEGKVPERKGGLAAMTILSGESPSSGRPWLRRCHTVCPRSGITRRVIQGDLAPIKVTLPLPSRGAPHSCTSVTAPWRAAGAPRSRARFVDRAGSAHSNPILVSGHTARYATNSQPPHTAQRRIDHTSLPPSSLTNS